MRRCYKLRSLFISIASLITSTFLDKMSSFSLSLLMSIIVSCFFFLLIFVNLLTNGLKDILTQRLKIFKAHQNSYKLIPISNFLQHINARVNILKSSTRYLKRMLKFLNIHSFSTFY
jgi:hypothetical protein